MPDCPEHPYLDSAITKALQGADVRILNWRKKDISIAGLRKAAPNVGSLHLYSSGNLDVLRYWTSYQGLCQFKEVT